MSDDNNSIEYPFFPLSVLFCYDATTVVIHFLCYGITEQKWGERERKTMLNGDIKGLLSEDERYKIVGG